MQFSVVSKPWGVTHPFLFSPKRNIAFLKRRTGRIQADSDPEPSSTAYDEGAAQVRRLMKRDRERFSGPDFESLLNDDPFASDISDTLPESEDAEAENIVRNKSDIRSKTSSPFGQSTSRPMNPFDSGPLETGERFEEPFDRTVDQEPWWSFVKDITLTQILLVCSFTFITAAMVGTFFFVLNSGGIHFND